MALTKEAVVSALRTCRDPEIPVNLEDLGLTYGVGGGEVGADSGQDVGLRMPLASPGGPMAHSLSSEVPHALLNLERMPHAKCRSRVGTGLASRDDHRRGAPAS